MIKKKTTLSLIAGYLGTLACQTLHLEIMLCEKPRPHRDVGLSTKDYSTS